MGMFLNGLNIRDSSDGEEKIYALDSQYSGFFLSGSTGAPDVGGYKSISNTYSVDLSKSISDCQTGIKIYLAKVDIRYYSKTGHTEYSNDSSQPELLIFKHDAPNALLDVLGTRFTITISENKLKLNEDQAVPMGRTGTSLGDPIYDNWAIKGIYAY